MYMLQILASLVALSGAIVKELNHPPVNTPCPPGTAYNPVQHNNCTCVNNHARIVSCRYQCGEFEVGVLIGYCMTMNSKRSDIVVGSCPFISPTHSKTYTRLSWMEHSAAMLTELVSWVGSV